MAATALSIASPTPKPALVASRRIEFRIAHNSFSRWKYGRWTASSPTAAASRDRLVADGMPRAKITIVNEGVDVDRIERLPPANVHAAFYLPTQAPVVGNVAALVPHKGQHYLIDAAAIVVRSRSPTCVSSSSATASSATRSKSRSGTSISSATCSWPASVTTRWS